MTFPRFDRETLITIFAETVKRFPKSVTPKFAAESE
jgi:hypothetical protein